MGVLHGVCGDECTGASKSRFVTGELALIDVVPDLATFPLNSGGTAKERTFWVWNRGHAGVCLGCEGIEKLLQVLNLSEQELYLPEEAETAQCKYDEQDENQSRPNQYPRPPRHHQEDSLRIHVNEQ